MPNSRDTDPYAAHYFALEIDGTHMAHFMECSGLKSVATVFEIEEGGLNGRTHKRPGQSRWENIVLRYATSASLDLLAWRDEYVRDQFAKSDKKTANKRTGAIVLYDNAHEEIRRYSFTQAWPVSWEGPSLNAGASELAVETLEIAHEGILVT